MANNPNNPNDPNDPRQPYQGPVYTPFNVEVDPDSAELVNHPATATQPAVPFANPAYIPPVAFPNNPYYYNPNQPHGTQLSYNDLNPTQAQQNATQGFGLQPGYNNPNQATYGQTAPQGFGTHPGYNNPVQATYGQTAPQGFGTHPGYNNPNQGTYGQNAPQGFGTQPGYSNSTQTPNMLNTPQGFGTQPGYSNFDQARNGANAPQPFGSQPVYNPQNGSNAPQSSGTQPGYNPSNGMNAPQYSSPQQIYQFGAPQPNTNATTVPPTGAPSATNPNVIVPQIRPPPPGWLPLPAQGTTYYNLTGISENFPDITDMNHPFVGPAHRARELFYFVNDGPPLPGESVKNWRLRLENATERMGIEHRITTPMPFFSSPDGAVNPNWKEEVNTRQKQIKLDKSHHRWRLDPNRSKKTVTGSARVSDILYDPAYAAAWASQRAIRRAANARRRFHAVSEVRDHYEKAGYGRLPTPEPPPDSDDELYDWDHRGTMRTMDPANITAKSKAQFEGPLKGTRAERYKPPNDPTQLAPGKPVGSNRNKKVVSGKRRKYYPGLVRCKPCSVKATNLPQGQSLALAACDIGAINIPCTNCLNDNIECEVLWVQTKHKKYDAIFPGGHGHLVFVDPTDDNSGWTEGVGGIPSNLPSVKPKEDPFRPPSSQRGRSQSPRRGESPYGRTPRSPQLSTDRESLQRQTADVKGGLEKATRKPYTLRRGFRKACRNCQKNKGIRECTVQRPCDPCIAHNEAFCDDKAVLSFGMPGQGGASDDPRNEDLPPDFGGVVPPQMNPMESYIDPSLMNTPQPGIPANFARTARRAAAIPQLAGFGNYSQANFNSVPRNTPVASQSAPGYNDARYQTVPDIHQGDPTPYTSNQTPTAYGRTAGEDLVAAGHTSSTDEMMNNIDHSYYPLDGILSDEDFDQAFGRFVDFQENDTNGPVTRNQPQTNFNTEPDPFTSGYTAPNTLQPAQNDLNNIPAMPRMFNEPVNPGIPQLSDYPLLDYEAIARRRDAAEADHEAGRAPRIELVNLPAPTGPAHRYDLPKGSPGLSYIPLGSRSAVDGQPIGCNELVDEFGNTDLDDEDEFQTCDKHPTRPCDAITHTYYNICQQCHVNNDREIGPLINLAVERTKIHCCQECTDMIRRGQTKDVAMEISCTCSTKLTYPWLCRRDLRNACKRVDDRALAVTDDLIRRRGGRAFACARCDRDFLRDNANAWWCMSCSTYVYPFAG